MEVGTKPLHDQEPITSALPLLNSMQSDDLCDRLWDPTAIFQPDSRRHDWLHSECDPGSVKGSEKRV
jgi:hypothetical protein